MTDSIVQLNAVEKQFGRNKVLNGCTLDIKEGEFVTLLGPSGCGKTTLLRIIAGFEYCDKGSVQIAGHVMGDLPPHKRPVNMVFQKYALFPHLNVYENIAFGLRLKRFQDSQIRDKVGKVLELVRLPGFENRSVLTLSGGESQRIALARAIVNEPRVLLLDEPLAALDLKIRKAMQEELKRIHGELATTFVYVTHDQEEALVMSDRIVVMCSGTIMQVGTPFEIYYEPTCLFAGKFVGESNILNGRVQDIDGQKAYLDTGDVKLWGRLRQEASVDQMASMLIRPEAICVREGHSEMDCDNSMGGVLSDVILIGGLVVYQVETYSGIRLRASEHIGDPDRILARGKLVSAYWNSKDALIFVE